MRVRVDQRSFRKEQKRLDDLFRGIAARSLTAVKEEADAYCELVKTGIGVTSPPPFAPRWEPLSYIWKQHKTANIDLFWKETGGIYNAVKTTILRNTTKLISVFGGILRKTDDAAFIRAQRNEYGLGLGPARELFEPAKDVSTTMRSSGRKLKSVDRFRKLVVDSARGIWKP